MRKMLIAVALLLIWPGATFAAELMVKVPIEEYRETKNQLDELKKKLDALEIKINQAPEAQAGYSDSKLRKMDRDISEIYDTLDEVETAALLDRISLGAEVRVRMDNYRVQDYVGAYVDFQNPLGPTWTPISAKDERNDANFSSRFRINMDAEISKTVRFAGRLALQKNWADSTGVFFSQDTNRAHASDGTTNLKVDRFYIDWTPKFFTPVSVSFGRLPTTDGPPLEFKEDRKRQSVYPALIFDGEPDGLVLTAGTERYLHLKNSGIRYFFAMAVQYDNDQLSMNYLDSVWDDSYKDNQVHALFFETEIPGLRDSLLVLSYVPAKDILMQSPFSNDPNEATDNLGDITLYGAHLQVPNILGLGLDFFASYGENHNDPNGKTIEYAGTNFGLFSGTDPTDLTVDGAPTGSTTGRAWYAGFRYELPISVLNRPKIGFEYNQGNKYWFSYTPGPAEIFNRLATRGKAYDVYYIQPFNKHLILRTGFTKLIYEATGSGMPFGQPLEYIADMGQTDEPEADNFYVLLESRF